MWLLICSHNKINHSLRVLAVHQFRCSGYDDEVVDGVIYSLQQAIDIMDHKVCDARKKLNRLRHETVSKQRRLEELQTRYDEMVKDSTDAVTTDTGESDEAQVSVWP